MYADSDLKFDQPQAEVVFDRDKLRSQGVDLAQAGKDLSTLLGGNYVNRFSIQGRSYKVIPQVKRAERLTADQLSQIYVRGSSDKLVPLSTFATLKTTTEPRDLKRFQQLNAVHIQGVIPPGVSLVTALTFLETEAKKILPQGFIVDYAGESRQVRTEGGKFLGTFLLSAILIYLVLAAQFESFRDPFIILAGSVPLALAGSLLFSFLGFTTLNIYSQVGLITLVGLIAKNGILIVEFANQVQEQGKDKVHAVIEAAATRLRPDPDDDGRHGHGPHAARVRAGPGRRRAQQHRHHAGHRHDHRHGLHAVRRAVDLRPRREDAQGRGAGRPRARAAPADWRKRRAEASGGGGLSQPRETQRPAEDPGGPEDQRRAADEADRHEPPAEDVPGRGIVVHADVEVVGPHPAAELRGGDDLADPAEDQRESGRVARNAGDEEGEAPPAHARPSLDAPHDDPGRKADLRARHGGVGLVEGRNFLGAAEGLQDRDQPLLRQLAVRLGALEDVPADLPEDVGDLLGRQLAEALPQLQEVGVDPVREPLGMVHFLSFASIGAISESIRDRKSAAYRAMAPARRRPPALSQ